MSVHLFAPAIASLACDSLSMPVQTQCQYKSITAKLALGGWSTCKHFKWLGCVGS